MKMIPLLRRRWVPIAMVAVLLGAGTVGGFAMSETSEDRPAVGIGPGLVRPTYASIEAGAPGPISTRTVAGLGENFGTDVVVVEPAEWPEVKVARQDATVSAVSQFHFIEDGGRLIESGLAKVTTRERGDEPTKEGEAGAIVPDLDGALVWVVVFDHVTMPFGGPKPPVGEAKEASSAGGHAVFAVFVDPSTGRVVDGSQW